MGHVRSGRKAARVQQRLAVRLRLILSMRQGACPRPRPCVAGSRPSSHAERAAHRGRVPRAVAGCSSWATGSHGCAAGARAAAWVRCMPRRRGRRASSSGGAASTRAAGRTASPRWGASAAAGPSCDAARRTAAADARRGRAGFPGCRAWAPWALGRDRGCGRARGAGAGARWWPRRRGSRMHRGRAGRPCRRRACGRAVGGLDRRHLQLSCSIVQSHDRKD